MMKIYLGADHRGFVLKEKIKIWFEKNDLLHEDIGAFKLDPHDDYTLYSQKVASLVASKKNSLGVLLCGSGVGVDITANKFDSVRASIGINPEQVAAGRSDDDMNVLVIAADFTTFQLAIKMIDRFLHTPFSGKARYKKRLGEIARIEENN